MSMILCFLFLEMIHSFHMYVYIYIHMYDIVIQLSYNWFSWIFFLCTYTTTLLRGADIDGHGVKVSIHLQTFSIYKKPCYLVEHI